MHAPNAHKYVYTVTSDKSRYTHNICMYTYVNTTWLHVVCACAYNNFIKFIIIHMHIAYYVQLPYKTFYIQ